MDLARHRLFDRFHCLLVLLALRRVGRACTRSLRLQLQHVCVQVAPDISDASLQLACQLLFQGNLRFCQRSPHRIRLVAHLRETM